MMELLTDPAAWASLATLALLEIVLGVGGLFLIYKATSEIHLMLEGGGGHGKPGAALFASVLVQIFLLDLIFSLDSVLTAIGMAEHIEIMVAAIVIAVAVMLVAAEPMSAFVHKHPTVKMLALAFLLLIGVALIADAMKFHIPRGFLYFGIAFATGVEILNLLVRRRATQHTSETP